MLYDTIAKKETHWPHGTPIPAFIREILTTRPLHQATPFFRISERAKLTTFRQKDSIDGNKQLA